MASAPQLKIYTRHKEYVGCVKYAEDAAAVVGLYGDGATIRDGHRVKDIVWTEGVEEQLASESVDFVAEVVYRRILERSEQLKRSQRSQ